MCFSPLASFSASAVLAAGGAATYRRALKPAEKPFAGIPLVFALHQAIEGFVWITFGVPRVQTLFVQAYVLVSHVLWPTYVPFAVWRLETVAWRRRALGAFALFGASVSLYLLYRLTIGPISVELSGHGLAYRVPLPDVPGGIGAYVIATCGSCLFSSHRYVRIFGLALFGSFVISYWSYRQAFYSVWCFFAAVLSFIVYVHFRQKRPLA
jgi:hypothetical protein